jgi:hypothetical protein
MKQEGIDALLAECDQLTRTGDHADVFGDDGLVSRLAQALREENEKVRELVRVGMIHGWNGVENSKILSEFFNQTIIELKDELANERARHAQTKQKVDQAFMRLSAEARELMETILDEASEFKS